MEFLGISFLNRDIWLMVLGMFPNFFTVVFQTHSKVSVSQIKACLLPPPFL